MISTLEFAMVGVIEKVYQFYGSYRGYTRS